MAKMLIVKDNTNLVGNNVGDIIATYEGRANIYNAEDFINLIEFDELVTAIDSKDASAITEAKMNLAKSICVKEQKLIFDGVFDLIEIPDKSLGEVQNDILAVTPEKKTLWVDPDTGESKELVKDPNKPVRYEDGELKHNFDIVENSIVINKLPIGVVEK